MSRTHGVDTTKWITVGDTVAFPCTNGYAPGTMSTRGDIPSATHVKSWLKFANSMLFDVRSAMATQTKRGTQVVERQLAGPTACADGTSGTPLEMATQR